MSWSSVFPVYSFHSHLLMAVNVVIMFSFYFRSCFTLLNFFLLSTAMALLCWSSRSIQFWWTLLHIFLLCLFCFQFFVPVYSNGTPLWVSPSSTDAQNSWTWPERKSVWQDRVNDVTIDEVDWHWLQPHCTLGVDQYLLHGPIMQKLLKKNCLLQYELLSMKKYSACCKLYQQKLCGHWDIRIDVTFLRGLIYKWYSQDTHSWVST